jgi:hypothetical protein
MFDRVERRVGRAERARQELREVVAGFDPSLVDPDTAKTLVECFAEIERLAAAGKMLAAGRVAGTKVWADGGHRSTAEWLAATAGTTVGSAIEVLATAERLEVLPAVADAVRSGGLSEIQAREVTAAAAADPGAEEQLLAAAEADGVAGLRAECRRVVAAAMTREEQEARYERIGRRRYHRSWTDQEGAFCYAGRTTADQGMLIKQAVHAETDRIFRTAYREGRRESEDAYALDALAAICERAARPRAGTTGSAAKPGPKVLGQLRVDVTALRRGHTNAGETCEIAGVGPVPVGTARELLSDALLQIVITDGVDVKSIVHAGRTIRGPIRSALAWMYRDCAVAGCHRTRLENHHTGPGYAVTRRTRLDELVPLCHHHHDLITNHAWQLMRRPDHHYDCTPPPPPAPTAERGPPERALAFEHARAARCQL